MIIVAGGRQTGKTAAVCRWIAEDPDRRCVIVGTRDRKGYIVDRLRSHMMNYPWEVHVYVAQELQLGGYHRSRAFSFPEVAVDDAEYVFSVLFGTRLEFMSMNATYIPLGPAQPDTIRADASIVPEISAARDRLELDRNLNRPNFRGLGND